MWLRNAAEVALLLGTCVVSIAVPLLDLAGLLDAHPSIVERIPAPTLLGVGFLAGYVIMERRGTLDEIASDLDRQGRLLHRTYGVALKAYPNSGAWLDAITARAGRARRIDDVSWIETRKAQAGWSQADIDASGRNDAMVARVIHDPKVRWHEVCVFFPDEKHRFERERGYIQDRKATGYSLGYFREPSDKTPPRIGGFLIADGDTEYGEVFLSSTDSTMWLSVEHPAIVAYFQNYFDSL